MELSSILLLSLLSLLLLLPDPSLCARLIPYPASVQSEGVTHAAGTSFFYADLRTGKIHLVDVATSLTTRPVPPQLNRTAVGIHFNFRRSLLFAAGAGSPFTPVPALHVHAFPSGGTLASCPAPRQNGFVNDVVADRSFAYYTDSLQGVVYKLNLSALPACDVATIPLPRPLFTGSRGVQVANANGLIKYKGGLIIAHFDIGTIFFLDLLNGNMVQQILPNGALPGADGLDIDRKRAGSRLFISQNLENLVSEWRLDMDDRRKVSATFVRNYTSSLFGFPTTVAVSDEYIVATSSRFDNVDIFKPVPDNVTLGLVVFRRSSQLN